MKKLLCLTVLLMAIGYGGAQKVSAAEEFMVVIPYQFSYAGMFSEGMAYVGDPNMPDFDKLREEFGEINTRDYPGTGYINSSGKLVIPYQFDRATDFHNGVAAVRRDGEWGVVDKTGKFTADVYPDHYSVEGSDNGVYPAEKNGKWGFVDSSGKVIVPYQFEDAFGFSEGLAPVCVDGKWGYISLTVKSAYGVQKPITITVNGETLNLKGQNPEIVGGRVFVPMRELAQELGCTITWDAKTKTVSMSSYNQVLKHTIGTTYATVVNGTTLDVGVPSYIKNGNTMVSVRLFMLALPYNVEWDGTNYVVRLTQMAG